MLLCHKYFGGAEVTIGAVISHAWVRLPRRSRMDEERRLKSDFESERGELERQYKQRLQQVGEGSTRRWMWIWATIWVWIPAECDAAPLADAIRCLFGRHQEMPTYTPAAWSMGRCLRGLIPTVGRLVELCQARPPPTYLQVRAELEDEEMMQKRKMLEATDALVSEYKKQMEVRAVTGTAGYDPGEVGRGCRKLKEAQAEVGLPK